MIYGTEVARNGSQLFAVHDIPQVNQITTVLGGGEGEVATDWSVLAFTSLSLYLDSCGVSRGDTTTHDAVVLDVFRVGGDERGNRNCVHLHLLFHRAQTLKSLRIPESASI